MWQIVIEPGHGAYVGMYDNGNQTGPFIEAELAKILGFHIKEELERSRIRHKLLNYSLGTAPTMVQRLRDVDPTSILISLHFEKYKGLKNKSVLYFNKNMFSLDLAKWLVDPLNKWGNQCCERYNGCHIHQGKYPILERDAPSLVVSPCSLFAEDTQLYIQRLIPLAKILATSIRSWGVSKNPGLKWSDPYRGPQSVASNPGFRPV